MDDDPHVTLGVSEDTIGDLALLKPHLLHVTLDYGEPSEWGITGPVQCPDELTDKSPPLRFGSGELDVHAPGTVPMEERALHINHHKLKAFILPSSRHTVREEVSGGR